MSKLCKWISSVAVVGVLASTMTMSASAKVSTFNNVTLGNYVMSGELDGNLHGGYAWTWCNKNVYFIHVAVEGYVVGDNGECYDEGRGERTRYNTDRSYAFVGGHEDIGLVTGSFWSAHEIRDGVNGVGRYLATIDV